MRHCWAGRRARSPTMMDDRTEKRRKSVKSTINRGDKERAGVKRLLIILALALALLAFFYFDLGEQLTLDNLKSRLGEIDAFYRANPLLVIGVFFAAYVLLTAASIPGAAIRSEEHTSELQSLMRTSYAVFC